MPSWRSWRRVRVAGRNTARRAVQTQRPRGASEPKGRTPTAAFACRVGDSHSTSGCYLVTDFFLRVSPSDSNSVVRPNSNAMGNLLISLAFFKKCSYFLRTVPLFLWRDINSEFSGFPRSSPNVSKQEERALRGYARQRMGR